MVVTGSKGYKLNANLKPSSLAHFMCLSPSINLSWSACLVVEAWREGRGTNKKKLLQQCPMKKTMLESIKTKTMPDNTAVSRSMKKLSNRYMYDPMHAGVGLILSTLSCCMMPINCWWLQVLLIDEMTDSMDHRARYQRHRRVPHITSLLGYIFYKYLIMKMQAYFAMLRRLCFML